MTNRPTVVGLVWVLVLLTISGCGVDQGPAHENEAQAGSLLVRGNGDDPRTLDPSLAEDVHTFNVLVDIYEGLLAEAADGSLIQGVAESWNVSDDGLVYRFQFRPDARWSNGELVRAEDFVNGFRRVLAPDSQSPYGFLLEPVENFTDVSNGTKSAEALGIVAIDERTLEIRLSSPSPHFLSVLAMPIAFPVYGDDPRPEQFSDPIHFVGNGPYVLADRQAGKPILLRRNNLYWDKQSVAIDKVQYVPVIDEMTEFNMYRTGELDFTGTVPASAFKDIKKELPSELRVFPALALYYLAFDLSEAPMNDKTLRQALSMAIDRTQITELLGRGDQPAYSVVPPGVANHDGAAYAWRELPASEREQYARELYNDAGYDSENPLTLTLSYDVGSVHERVALAVSSMWADVLGVVVELEKMEWQLYLAMRNDRPSWQVMRFSWFGDYNDARTFTDLFRSESLQNLPGYKNRSYDDLLAQAVNEIRMETRKDIMSAAEKVLIDDYPIAPLYFFVSKHLVKPHVAGFEDNILDRHPSKYLSILNNPTE